MDLTSILKTIPLPFDAVFLYVNKQEHLLFGVYEPDVDAQQFFHMKREHTADGQMDRLFKKIVFLEFKKETEQISPQRNLRIKQLCLSWSKNQIFLCLL